MLRLFANANYDFIAVRRYAYARHGPVHRPRPAVPAHGARAQLQHRVHRRHAGAGAEQAAGRRRRAPRRPRPRRAPRRRDPELRRAQRVRRPRAGGQARHRRQRHPGHRRRGAPGARPACSAPASSRSSRTEAVGPKVGGELRQKAFLAIFLSFFAVLAYLATGSSGASAWPPSSPPRTTSWRRSRSSACCGSR